MKQLLCKRLFLFAAGCLATLASTAQLPSFPGAEGAGALTSGGRGTPASATTVFEVTSLADNNTAGTLRWALTQSAIYRTVVFRISGIIHLTSKLSIKGNTTVAGQTAPGGGICLADYPVVISGDNVIVRYLRFRMGDKNELITNPAGCGLPVAPFSASCAPVDGSGGDDAFGDLGNKNLMIDHCSVSWSDDEALTVYRGDSVTMQWNIISEPLNYSYHFETGDADFEHHGYGGIWGSQHGSFHHNLFAHCQSRNPRFGGNSTYPAGAIETCDFRNNVIYNWGLYTVYGGEGGQYNLVNNYYKYGPSTGTGTKYRIVNVDSTTTLALAKYYITGNYVDGSPIITASNWLGAQMKTGKLSDTGRSKMNTPLALPALTTDSAAGAYNAVLAGAGATLPMRDTLDQRVINDVKNRAGRLIDVQGGYAHGTAYSATVNAWPALATLAAPADADHDGMPDYWETSRGLNPNDPTDRNGYSSTGYTNLEDYLNGITGNIPTTSVPNTSGTSMSVFPNPATNKITLSLPVVTEAGTASVYNVQGQQIAAQAVAKGAEHCAFSIAAFPAGTYFIVYRSNSIHAVAAFLKQ